MTSTKRSLEKQIEDAQEQRQQIDDEDDTLTVHSRPIDHYTDQQRHDVEAARRDWRDRVKLDPDDPGGMFLVSDGVILDFRRRLENALDDVGVGVDVNTFSRFIGRIESDALCGDDESPADVFDTDPDQGVIDDVWRATVTAETKTIIPGQMDDWGPLNDDPWR